MSDRAERRTGDGVSQHVRDAVAAVVRDARDAPDEPFDGELALALTLHAWAHLIAHEMEPHAFAIVAYGASGARYEDVTIDVLESDVVPCARLDAALDAICTDRVTAALVAVPVALSAPGTFGFPSGVQVRIEDDGDRDTVVLFVDPRSRGRGLTVRVEPGTDGVLRNAGDAGPLPLPDGFVTALGGFPWARASGPST